MSNQPQNGRFTGLSTDELRAAIRAVLREVLPPAGGTVAASTGDEVELVTLRTDADVALFVRRLAAMCEDPAQRTALRDGPVRFRLAAGDTHPRTAALAGTVIRVDRGAVTERRVKQASAEGARLIVGPRAVLTPLARDRARTMGVVVEKEH